MLKKTITYEDLNGDEVTEDFFFNMTLAEFAEMEFGTKDGFSDYLKKIIESKDINAIMKEFKKIILKAYGIKSDDGKRFIKGEEISKQFEQHPAYDVLFMELITDEDGSANFVNGLIPVSMRGRIADAVGNQRALTDVSLPPEPVKKFNDYTERELLEMDQETFQSLVPSKPKDMSRNQLLIAMRRKEMQDEARGQQQREP